MVVEAGHLLIPMTLMIVCLLLFWWWWAQHRCWRLFSTGLLLSRRGMHFDLSYSLQSNSTPLDIGILLNNGSLSTLSQNMKLKLLNHTPDVKYKYPMKYMNGRNRRFKPEWVHTHSWLHYSASEDGVFCKACALFAPSEVQQQKLGSLISKPFSLWMKQSSAFNSHEKLSYHHTCMMKWLLLKSLVLIQHRMLLRCSAMPIKSKCSKTHR